MRVCCCPLTHRFQNLQLVLDSLAASTDVLAMLSALLLVLLVVSATVLYFTENALVEGTWFDSIPVTMYYMHVSGVCWLCWVDASGLGAGGRHSVPSAMYYPCASGKDGGRGRRPDAGGINERACAVGVLGTLVPLSTQCCTTCLPPHTPQVTLTTTGYGDLYPSSAWGKFIAGVFMLLCMVTLSLPISVIGGNFSSLWGRYNTIKDGLGRSAGAWGVARRLGGVAAAQCGALEDLMGAVTRVMVRTRGAV